MKDAVDVHCGLGSVFEESWKANAVVGRWRGSSGRRMHDFSEVFVFEFGGCTIVESEKLGWIGRWGGAVGWEERDMFHSC